MTTTTEITGVELRAHIAEILDAYNRVVEPAWAEYNRVVEPAWAERDRVVEQARAEYNRVVEQAQAECDRVVEQAWAERDRVVEPAWAAYNRVVEQARAERDNSLLDLQDPTVTWIVQNTISSHETESLDVLRILPDFDAIDTLAEESDWCGTYTEYREQAEAAGVLPEEVARG